MTEHLLVALNDRQREAVTLGPVSALILAGAGSGKTRVLTTRIAWLIHNGLVSPQGILAVTFTNKAAREMLTRLSAMLPINTRGMWIGTFHGLCNRFLKTHHREANLPAMFQILDAADQLAVIKRLLKQMNVDEQKYPARQVQAYINGAKEEGLRADRMEAYDRHSEKLREIFAEYDAQCQREGVVDFAELLLRCHEMLGRDSVLRRHYQERFRYILVDEFQDTSRLQYSWLKLLAGPTNAVFAVGDDDQSIYAFRGARADNMQDFQRDFNVQHVIKLEQNYRSHSNILEAANAIIAHNKNRLGKNLWTAEGQGEPIRLFDAYNDQDEAAFIVDEVKALAAEGVALSQIAVLYRSNAQSRVLEHALFSAGISYRVYGGLRFFERAEIKHALAYLRLVANPDDDTALLRVINFPARGIGARSLEQLQEAARGQEGSLWQAAQTAGGKVAAFTTLIKSMQESCNGLPLPEMVAAVIQMSGLKQHYLTEKEGADRIANLDELVNAAITFVNENDADSLVDFLTFASLEAGEHQADPGHDALQLMTVHAAKGLEFHTVFISGLEEGLFPHEQSMIEHEGLEEERRLMYVAVTRARRRLYLSHAQSRMLHGQVRYNIPSRFLDEIPQALLKRLNARVPSQAMQTGGGMPSISMPWRIGEGVRHPKFGQGVILAYEGGSDARVQVNFRDAGTKWLALEYAKLEKL
ncbi:MAG: UvrD-helicase domain-containing protein [Methylophilaceae bacterium]|nr:UvrD-helicase domain-containing protein [Methylophilaceae bacterium]